MISGSYLKTTLALLISLTLAGCSMFGSKKSSGKEGEDGDLSEYDLNAAREGRYGSGGIPLAEGEGFFRDVHFGYDSSEISDQARQNIEYNLEVLRKNPNVQVQLEGHCDERGTAEYNLALGEKRARSVYEVLVSYGLTPKTLDTISYGEEVPLDSTMNEAAYSKNRRVHFTAFTDKADS